MFKYVRRIAATLHTDLEAVGLSSPIKEGYKTATGLPVVTWPHHKPGTRVQLIAPPGAMYAWRYIATQGSTGTVENMVQGMGEENFPKDDLYKILLDKPLKSGKAVAYVPYEELKKID